jgi:hypothetical protein
MLEEVKESDKLKAYTAIYDAMTEGEQEYYGDKQYFLEICLEKGIEIIGTDDESRTLKLAESITRMADSLDELLKTGINRKLLVLYIHDTLGSKHSIGKTKIEMVLDAVLEFIDETREA